MVIDSISNLIVHIKNSGDAGLDTATTSYSKMKFAILKLLEREGYVGKVSEKAKKGSAKSIEVELVYADKKPAISGVARISKFSRRVYSGAKEISPVKNGYGLVVLTTPKGVMTGEEAKKENVGGEILFKIW